MRAGRIRIRRASKSDAAALVEMEALFPSDRMNLRSIRRFITSKSARVLVATRDGEPIGNLVLLLRSNSRKGRIYSVVVSPAARGLGVGDRLVQSAERIAREAGRDTVTLEVREDNGAARALYARRRYVESRKLPRFYEDGGDGLRLERALLRRRISGT